MELKGLEFTAYDEIDLLVVLSQLPKLAHLSLACYRHYDIRSISFMTNINVLSNLRRLETNAPVYKYLGKKCSQRLREFRG